MANKKSAQTAKRRAYIYMRLSADKEGGQPQSIDAQRHALLEYAKANGFEIVAEFADSGYSGTNDKRPQFKKMIKLATDKSHPVDAVLFYMFNRLARDMRLFITTTGALEDAGVQPISITENFGNGQHSRLGRNIVAVVAEQQSHDTAMMTRKSRRENARQGFYNGGPIAFGYRSYTARVDGEKQRKKLEVIPEEAAVVKQIFDWAEVGRGVRWIAKNLNQSGVKFRGKRFNNGNVFGILKRSIYTGVYHDMTADDYNVKPDISDAIAVPVPAIVTVQQFERASAASAERNPMRSAPHVSAGTTLLTGIVRCGIPGCGAGLTIRTGKSGQYAYYACNDRVNCGGKCPCPSIRREKLDEIVISALESELLAPERLLNLLSGLLDQSDRKRESLQANLSSARADKTRLDKAMTNLLMLVENGVMTLRDPQLAERIATNRSDLALVVSQIDLFERQLAQGKRRIDEATIKRFGKLLSAKLRDKDNTLRSAYIKMFVDAVTVSHEAIVISGQVATLESGVSTGLPVKPGTVPSFDQQWCPKADESDEYESPLLLR